MTSSLLHLIAGGARRLQEKASSSLVSLGIDPTPTFLPFSEIGSSFTLDLPPSIDGDLIALGYSEPSSRELSDAYLSAARRLRDASSARCHTILKSLSSCVSATTELGWQARVEKSVRTQYISNIGQLHQATLRKLRENRNSGSQHEVRTADKPFDHVSIEPI
jgi:hypothetical protein